MNLIKGIALALGAMTLPAWASVDASDHTDYRRTTYFGQGPRGTYYYGHGYSGRGPGGGHYGGYHGGFYNSGHYNRRR